MKRPSAVPYAEAARVWREFSLSEPRDLVLEDVAIALGVLVIDAPLDSGEARLVRKGGHGVARIREGLAPSGRRRFVVGHELGHWLLHEDVSQIFVCTSSDMIVDYRKSRIEAEANYFSSALLMPPHLFGPMRGSEGPSFDNLTRLAEYFGTSLTATAIRWMDLASDYCALVASKAGRIRWWRASERFEECLWIDAGHAVSSFAAASKVSAIEPHAARTEVTIDTWAEPRQGLTTDTLIEEARYLGRYDTVLSLLWLP